MPAENTYIKKLETELKKLDRQIGELKKKKSKLDKSLHSKYNTTMAILVRKKGEVKQHIKEGKAAWRAITKGVEAAWKSLKTSVQQARKEFK